METLAIQPNIALDIQFRHMPKSNKLRRVAMHQVETLRRLTSCHSRCEVVFDQTHSAKQGNLYQVTIRLHVPGQPLYVTHHTEFGGSKELLFAALNDAFSEIRRQLRKYRTKNYRHRRLAA